MIFRNEYYFLSNMYPCQIHLRRYNYYTFQCVESAYQAFKCPDRLEEFLYLNGYEAKKLGKQVAARYDWNSVKCDIMKSLLIYKFTQNPYLGERLTNMQEEIVEENTWGDTYWGVCRGVGENMLGKLLMEVREELRRN